FLKYVLDSFKEKYEKLKKDPYADEENQDEYLAENIFWFQKKQDGNISSG
ncbi:Type I restriction-modification system,DNA-methyltransferase subunit M, partial [Staphylococcus epidermidis 36-1]